MARRAVTVDAPPPTPESDRVDGFAHPRETNTIFGHAKSEHHLATAFAGGRLHHGWLFSGPPGIGKATLAYRFAKHILAPKTERTENVGPLDIPENSKTARLIRAQAHPGLLVLRRPFDPKAKRFATQIPIDEVRKLRGFLTHSGTHNDAWRVVIIDTADDMTLNAANAVLKSLEEPPARTVFLLMTSEPGRLLPTIRSRCRTLQLNPLNRDDLARAVDNAFQSATDIDRPDAATLERVLTLSKGRIGRVLRLIANGGVEVSVDVDALLHHALSPNWRKVHAIGDKVAPIAAVPRFELLCNLLQERLSDLIRSAAGVGLDADGAAQTATDPLAGKLVAPESLAEWARAWEDTARKIAQTQALHLDRKAIVVETAIKLAELSRAAHGKPAA